MRGKERENEREKRQTEKDFSCERTNNEPLQQQQQQQLLPNNNPNKSKCLIVLSERAGEEMRMNQEVESRDRNQKKHIS